MNFHDLTLPSFREGEENLDAESGLSSGLAKDSK
jgi:hypothetical protein